MDSSLKIKFIVEFDKNNSPIDLEGYFNDIEVSLREFYEIFLSGQFFCISISVFQNIKVLCKNYYGNDDKTGNFSYAMFIHNTSTIKTCIPSFDEINNFKESLLCAFSSALIYSFPSKQSEIYNYIQERLLSPFKNRLKYKYHSDLFSCHCEAILSKKTIDDLEKILTKTYEKTSELWNLKENRKTNILIFKNYKSFYDSFFSDNVYSGVLGILAGISPCHVIAIPNPESIESDTNGKKNYLDMIRATAHEFVHKMNFIIAPYNSYPYWIFEGIAEKLTTDKFNTDLKQIDNSIEVEKIFTENLEDFYSNHGYTIAPIILNYIEKQYGEATFKQILNTPSRYLEILYPEIQDKNLQYAEFTTRCNTYIEYLIKDV